MINCTFMARKLLIIPFVVALLFSIPAYSHTTAAIEIIDIDKQEITISVKASTIHVTGADGETMHVYNVAGVRVASIKVEGMDRHYDLNLPKGCYIVKVGRVTRKISIK